MIADQEMPAASTRNTRRVNDPVVLIRPDGDQ